LELVSKDIKVLCPYELIASKMRASPVILNEVKHLLHLNEEILRCALLGFQETTRNEFFSEK
jgi:hypothetical protein